MLSRTILFWLIVATLPSCVSTFVVLPPMKLTQPTSNEKKTNLYKSDKKEKSSSNNFWTQLSQPFRPPPPETRQRREHRRQVQQQAKQALRHTPWPFRMLGNTITSSVGRVARQAGRQLDPLLQQAQTRLQQNNALVVALGGGPVTVGNEISSSTSHTIINGSKTQQITATFHVHGSQRDGIGALVATNSRTIVSLQVTIGGRTIAVDL